MNICAEIYFADDADVDAIASRILSKHIRAFEELAK